MRKTMPKNVAGFLIVGIAVSAAANAESGIRLRAGVGYGDYTVTSNLQAGNGPTVDYKANYSAIPVGLTFIFDNDLYVDLLHQEASGKAKFDWSSESPSFKRDDTTLTIGARKGNVSFYVGYKTGEANTNWPTSYSPDKLVASGFLAGFGWAIPLSSSAFNIGAGVGLMTGTYTYSVTNGVPSSLTSDTTIGYSISAGYTYVFGPRWSLNTDLKWQAYNYSFGGGNSLKENPAQLALNLLYSF